MRRVGSVGMEQNLIFLEEIAGKTSTMCPRWVNHPWDGVTFITDLCFRSRSLAWPIWSIRHGIIDDCHTTAYCIIYSTLYIRHYTISFYYIYHSSYHSILLHPAAKLHTQLLHFSLVSGRFLRFIRWAHFDCSIEPIGGAMQLPSSELVSV